MKKILIIILSTVLIAGCTNNSADIPENEIQETIDETQETNNETVAIAKTNFFISNFFRF